MAQLHVPICASGTANIQPFSHRRHENEERGFSSTFRRKSRIGTGRTLTVLPTCDFQRPVERPYNDLRLLKARRYFA